ncbi:MAG: RNA polymerase sigma factor [Sphingomonadales bacterium]|nr:RNA polymerase sigma factor [Sphingomonadales bacterium]MDE2170975.1 RNA polymerase sigma factor [Sphingomonadales bacterium]
MYCGKIGRAAVVDADFTEALNRSARALRSYAWRLTGNAADTDDLVQETMLLCWSARHLFQPGSNFSAWSRVVMRNSFLSNLRRDRVRTNLPQEAFDLMPGTAGGQDQAIELRDTWWALDRLSPQHRNAVLLAAKGISYTEGAAQLAIPEVTFRSHVFRGRRHLRRLIDDFEAQTRRRRQ